MYYVNIDADVLDKHEMIKEEQRALFNNVCCKQKRFNR